MCKSNDDVSFCAGMLVYTNIVNVSQIIKIPMFHEPEIWAFKALYNLVFIDFIKCIKRRILINYEFTIPCLNSTRIL